MVIFNSFSVPKTLLQWNHRYTREILEPVPFSSRPPIPLYMASSAMGLKLGLFRFLPTIYTKTDASTIFVHCVPFCMCLSSSSNCIRCRWHTHLRNHGYFNYRNKAVLEPQVSPAFAITYFCNHCNTRFENTSKYVDTLTLFSKNLNQRSLTPTWPLTPCLLRSHVWLYPRIIVSKSHDNTSIHIITNPYTVHEKRGHLS